MQFANPMYLFALAGIIIPIVVHLWNRMEGKVIKVGSIRFMSESESSRFNAIQLNEVILLILRILVVILLVLILAGLQYRDDQSFRTTVLIDRQITGDPDVRNLLDSIKKMEDVRYFENGFPIFDGREGSVKYKTDQWTLLQQLESLNFDNYIIYSASLVKHFKGPRVPLPENVTWISVPVKNERRFLAGAYKSTKDSLTIVMGMSDENRLNYISEKKHIDQVRDDLMVNKSAIGLDLVRNEVWLVNQPEYRISFQPVPVFTVGIVFDSEFQVDVSYIRAAFEAIENYGAADFKLTTYQSGHLPEIQLNENDVLIFFTDDPRTLSDKVVIGYNENKYIEKLISPAVGKNRYFFTRRLNPRYTPESELDELPMEIMKLLISTDKEIKISKDNDLRKISQDQIVGDRKILEARAKAISYESAGTILWVLLLLTLLTERMVSSIKGQ